MIPLCRVDVSELVSWVTAIPFEAWPQQHKIDHQLRPAMVNDAEWHGMGRRTDALVDRLLRELQVPGVDCLHAYNRMLSVVMPGHSIPEHRDEQGPDWLTRVHVPLMTNPQAFITWDGCICRPEVGTAYLVDTRIRHAVANDGPTPRIHFMVDVRRL